MRDRQWSRRDLLKASTASVAGLVFAESVKAAPPPPSELTPALIEAAKKEGKVSFYTALELNTAERLARTFEARYPGISVRVERSGAETECSTITDACSAARKARLSQWRSPLP